VPNTEESEVVSCALPVWASAVFSRQREIEARRPLCALTRQRAQSCIACKLVKHHHARCARAARVARAAKGANGKGSCCVRRLAGRERHRPQGPARRSRGNERLKRGAHALCQTRQRVRWSRARCPHGHGPARSSRGNERLRRRLCGCAPIGRERHEVVSCALPARTSAVFSRQREVEARRRLCGCAPKRQRTSRAASRVIGRTPSSDRELREMRGLH
jgi:hypothetical protein